MTHPSSASEASFRTEVALLEAVITLLSASIKADDPGKTLREIELDLGELLDMIGHEVLCRTMQARANRAPDEITANGQGYRRERSGRVRYQTTFGPVWIERHRYVPPRHLRGEYPSIVPFEIDEDLEKRVTAALRARLGTGTVRRAR